MKGKLIVIEGTDCSGKETQSNLLLEYLKQKGIRTEKFSFPWYTSPTGRIVGGPYLGKEYICDGWFPEGAANVNPKLAALYYAADRFYHIEQITFLLEQGVNVIVDRYVYSNMAHQGGKTEDKEQRFKMYEWLEDLEFGLLELPKADIKVFLHMPYEAAAILKKNRIERPDQQEASETHLRNAEKAYIEIVDLYGFNTIECVDNDRIKEKEEISLEVKKYIEDSL